MQQKTLFALCFALAFASFPALALAVSSSEAISFVENKNHFLAPSETGEIYPVVRVSHNAVHYWVVSILSGNSIAGFVPVKDAKSVSGLAIASGTLARKQLIRVAHYLRLYDKLKNDFSQQGVWVLKNTDVDFFNSLSNELKNERIDLTTIGSELKGYPALQAQASELRSQLEELYPLAMQVSEAISDFKEKEAKFFSSPDTNDLAEFAESLDNVFSSIERLNENRSRYLADLDKLKQGIAQTGLSVESKRSLNALANVPMKMIEVSGRITNALNIKEKTDEAYAMVLNQSDNFVQDLAVREKRNAAWLAMYGFDPKIVEETKLQGVESVKSLVELVLSQDYVFQWREQRYVAKLKESWSKAQAYYKAGSFDSAKKFAGESKDLALKVFKAGLSEPEQPINTDLLFTGVVLLIIAIIIIYAIRNREKLKILVSSEPMEEEVPIHEWEK